MSQIVGHIRTEGKVREAHTSMYDINRQPDPQRKPYDEIHTADEASYSQFVKLNICDVSAKVEAASSPSTSRFVASGHAFSAGDLTILRIKTTGGRFRAVRTMACVNTDLEQRYAVTIPITGKLEVQQMGRTAQSGPGTIAMTCSTDPDTFSELDDENDILVAMLPRHFVESRLIRPAYFCARTVSGGGLSGLALASAASLHENAGNMTAPVFDKAIQMVGELILAAVSNLADVQSSLSSVRAGNLLRAKRIIRSRCSDPDLTVEDVANECGISLRYLQDLFTDDGRSCREYIKHERLYLGRRLLQQNSSATTAVLDISRAAGFSNFSHFSKEFRKAFSVTPREVLEKRKRRVD
jgi:AraC-like DNA-binding protein